MFRLRAPCRRGLHRSPAVAAAYLVAVTVPCPGCDRSCEGPGCEASWPATRLAVHEPARWSDEVDVWRDAREVADGRADRGASWAVRVHRGLLWIGQPEAGTVAVVPPPDGGGSLLDGADGLSLTGDGARFGHALDVAGRRLLVGAPGEDLARGGVWVFDRVPDAGTLTTDDAAVHLQGDALGDRLGTRVVACPDTDGDGLAEWLLAAPGVSDRASLAGAVAWIRSTDLATATGDVPVGEIATVWTSDVPGARLGSDVACGRDLSGDGIPDLALGAPFTGGGDGAVYLLDGADLPPAGPIADRAARTLHGPAPNGWFGSALALGDFDGDDRGDLAVGAPGADAGRGRVLVYRADDLLTALRISPSSVIPGDRTRSPGDHLGRTVVASDLDGDGREDLLVAAPDWRLGDATDVGRLFVWRGAPTWPATLPLPESADHVVVGNRAFQRVGLGLATGDLDGDGTSEVVLTTRIRAPR